jgi:cytochrome b pre-mRNA-processing protein 3
MIAKLFRRLTADPGAGAALFDWATTIARERGWYVEGSIPDTIDGRFAVLSTVTALCSLRLEQLGGEGEALSVALTERFAQVMESEHRELGIGDPTLGKTVLKLVGALERRVDALRPAMGGKSGWAAAAGMVLLQEEADGAGAWRARRLEMIAKRLRAAGIDDLARGEIR